MILPEPPGQLAFDGALVTFATWVVAVGAPAVIALGTAAIVVLRVMLLFRKWKEHK